MGVHGPIACSGNSWNSRGSLSSGSTLYKMGFTTDISENDIIFGGEKKLYKAVVQKYKIPVIPVHSPGFVGSKNLRNRLGGEALLQHVIGSKEPKYTTNYDINIVGEYNIA